MLRSTLTHSTRRATAAVVASSSSSSQQVARLALVFPAAAAARIGSSVQQPQRRAYHEKVMDHYNKPRNVGSMDKTDKDVGTGLVGAPACGDVMKLQIRVDENGIISDVRFKTFGCGSAIASSSFITEHVKGMTLEQAGNVKNTEIAKELSLPPVKLHCSMLAEDAIKSAIRNYKSKRPTVASPIVAADAAPSASTTTASA